MGLRAEQDRLFPAFQAGPGLDPPPRALLPLPTPVGTGRSKPLPVPEGLRGRGRHGSRWSRRISIR